MAMHTRADQQRPARSSRAVPEQAEVTHQARPDLKEEVLVMTLAQKRAEKAAYQRVHVNDLY
jgi:hypothetical protein